MKDIEKRDLKFKLNLSDEFSLYDKIAGDNIDYLKNIYNGYSKLKDKFTYNEFYKITLSFVRSYSKYPIDYLLKNKIITDNLFPINLTVFHRKNEIYLKYVKKLKINNILLVGNYNNSLEILEYHNHDINNINILNINIGKMNEEQSQLSSKSNVLNKLYEKNSKWIVNKTIDITKIPNIKELLSVNYKNKLDYIDFTYLDWEIDTTLFDYQVYTLQAINDLYILNNIIFILENLKIGGCFNLYLISINNKIKADIYLILKKYFKKVEFFFPEISYYTQINHYCFLIGENYLGINEPDLNKLKKMNSEISNIYKNGKEDFNIYDKELRNKHNITKPITKKIKYIKGFLDIDLSNKDDLILYKNIIRKLTVRNYNIDIIYEDFRLYVDLIIDFIKFPDNMTTFIENGYRITPFKISNEQINDTILYLKKTNIYSEVFNKDNSNLQILTLNDIYCLSEPIIFSMKTSHQFYLVSDTKKTKKKDNYNTKTNTNKNTNNIKKLLNKNTTYRENLKEIRLNELTNLFKTKDSEFFTYNVSLTNRIKKEDNNLFNSELQIKSLLIRDNEIAKEITLTKKEITKRIQKIKKYIMYNQENNKKNLSIPDLLRFQLKQDNIDYHWAVIYEIIKNVNVISKSRIIHSTHFSNNNDYKSEINCLSYYLNYKKTNKSDINNKKLVPFHYKFNKINSSKEFWEKMVELKKNEYQTNLIIDSSDYDINNVNSIRNKFVNILSSLFLLEERGNLIIKLNIPINENIIKHLIYLFYKYFKEVVIIKPMLYSGNNSFYIIAKRYKKDRLNYEEISDSVDILDNFYPSISLNYDLYPETFVSQFQYFYNKLVNNYINYNDKLIYYYNHYEYLDRRFIEIAQEFVKEKRIEWINKYVME